MRRWAVGYNEFFPRRPGEETEASRFHALRPGQGKVPFAQIGFGKFVIRDLYQLLKQISPTAGSYLLNNFEENQKKWQAIEENVLSSGKPYEIKFQPPTREGGWEGSSSSGN